MECAILTLFQNQLPTDTLLLKPGRIVVGREGCDLIIEHPEMSSKHCKIEWIVNCFQVFDLHSTNGTFVNGSRIVKSKLQDGDKIGFGALQATFHLTPIKPPFYKKSLRFVNGALLPFPFGSLEPPLSLSTQARETLHKINELKNHLKESLKLKVTLEYPDGRTETNILEMADHELGRISPHFNLSTYEDVSRKHTAIRVLSQGLIAVEDLGSTNGTLVNNEPIEGITVIFSTDKIQMGPIEMKIQMVRVNC